MVTYNLEAVVAIQPLQDRVGDGERASLVHDNAEAGHVLGDGGVVGQVGLDGAVECIQ